MILKNCFHFTITIKFLPLNIGCLQTADKFYGIQVSDIKRFYSTSTVIYKVCQAITEIETLYPTHSKQ